MMMLRARNRATSGCKQGPGGRSCPCCDPAPRHNARLRRQVRASERAQWMRDVNETLARFTHSAV